MLRLLCPLVVLPCLTSSALAAEAWEGVYEGAIGQKRILVELATTGSRYSYSSRPNDLGLIVSAKSGVLNLVETLAPSIDAQDVKANARLISGRWILKQEGERLIGTWTNSAGGDKTNISLIRLTSQTNPPDMPQKPGSFGAYGARWLATAPRFVPMGGEASIGPLSYTLVRDDLYGNVLPRLTRAPAGVRIDGINNLLQTLHNKLVLGDRNCMQDLRASVALTDLVRLAAIDQSRHNNTRPATQTSMKPVYGSPAVLTILDVHTPFCGGAHPTTNIAAYSFDLKNPRQISALGNDDVPGDDLGTSALGAALDLAEPAKRARFDMLWVSRMRAQIQALKAKPRARELRETDEACATAMDADLAEKGGAIEKIAYPLPDGLAIRISGFPQVIAVCAIEFPPNPVIVPWREVLPFLKPAQKLFPNG